MTDRIRFITHRGKQILLVDLSNCSTAEVEKIIRTVPGVVTTRTRARASVLILSDFTGASVDEEAVRAMKENAVFDKPMSRDPHGWEQRTFLSCSLGA
jgi:mannose/fructose-specific phosphotransferase system component IIA